MRERDRDRIRNPYWSTLVEIEFVERLGTFGKLGIMSRKKALENYLAACEKRQRWANIDRYAVESHVRKLLEEINEKNVMAGPWNRASGGMSDSD